MSASFDDQNNQPSHLALSDGQIFLGETGIKLLYGITITAFLSCVSGIALNFTAGNGLFTGGSALGLVLSVCILFLLYRQRVRLALLSLLWILALLPILLGMTTFGMNGPGLFFVPIAVMAASSMLTPRHGLAIAISALLLTIIIFLFNEHGQFRLVLPTPMFKLTGFLTALVIASLIGLIGANALRTELNRVKQLANSLALKADQLQRSEISFSSLFRCNPLPSLTGDAAGRILDVNDAWLAVFGYRREEVIGRNSGELSLFLSEEERQQIARDTIAGRPVLGRQVSMRVANASTRHFLISTASFELSDGWRYVALLLDQTDRLDAEHALQELNLNLESRVAGRTADLSIALENLQRTQQELIQSEKLASLGAMVAGIAHELNTPVGNALMVISTLAHNQSEFEQHLEQGLKRTHLNAFLLSVSEVTDLVDRNLRRTADLIRSFKQVAVDQASEQRRPFDLDEVVNEISMTMSPLLRKSPYVLLNEVPQNIRMDSYPGPLGQVLINLVHNALKHAFEGRENGQFRIHATLLDEDKVRLTFSDNGLGISTQNIGHIFDPFFTTKLGQGGSGLGLSIVHNIVTGMLGGRIEVISTLGLGSEFQIELPLVAPHK
ncbi:sensor histidine kinase [Undibacterium sp. Ren11W]|uniref:sensor histidine kinase n=1 Tax=Undibacterium sp. Ren11W TaxID=3413045 RepID=UPI003BF113C9